MESRMQQHGSKCLQAAPYPGGGAKGQIATFSENGHVAYQINGKEVEAKPLT